MGMKEQEIMLMRYGDMHDMLSCMAIEDGGAEQIIKRRIPCEEAMRLK